VEEHKVHEVTVKIQLWGGGPAIGVEHCECGMFDTDAVGELMDAVTNAWANWMNQNWTERLATQETQAT
jgi:hypothetical protein